MKSKRSTAASAETVDKAVEKKTSVSGLGVRLRHTRLVAGLTLIQLAKKAECSESLISKIERGSATPSLVMLHRLAVALDTNISTLMSEEMPVVGPVLRVGERPVIKTGGISLERLVSVSYTHLRAHET